MLAAFVRPASTGATQCGGEVAGLLHIKNSAKWRHLLYFSPAAPPHRPIPTLAAFREGEQYSTAAAAQIARQNNEEQVHTRPAPPCNTRRRTSQPPSAMKTQNNPKNSILSGSCIKRRHKKRARMSLKGSGRMSPSFHCPRRFFVQQNAHDHPPILR